MNGTLRVVLNHMIKTGDLAVTDADGARFSYGDKTGTPVHIRFNSAHAERAVAFNPELKLAECFMDGEIDFLEGDIYTLLQIVFENTGPTAAKEPWMRAMGHLRILFRRFQQMNTLTRSSNNIKSHYDLSGELYDLFLDPDKQYSCAYFDPPNATLPQAQLAKKRHIAAKLLLKEGHKVLDIGCGWGGMGLYLARFLKANVTGVTLSEEQYTIANKRAAEEGLADRANFQLTDYRKIDDKFDRLVSVGMFEHVGVGHFAEYFEHAARLMKPDGIFMLHAIGRADGPGATNPFIRKYIFPGGYIPALSEVLPHIEKAGLYVTDIEILRLHYAETLKEWRKAFMANRDRAKALYDERFCRTWEFYLAASESAFRWQNMMVFHIQIAHKQESVPLTRNYIEAEEKRLKRLDSAPKGANSETESARKSIKA
ncbi:cyclopropane-fatty-acyl-phospholipid synthase family protein [Falsochrobactrum sp. TDYN1]|uniref:Cyclopropane-fatty-acyl-phospholipid synthase family protein n=1 Tax=Falsochrobactrum tianjinense TaxID=2706015 RepID=A0A949PLJ4_9HYPH|nr:cyclopropane-fatty-acyl-phospholipid synthase family protein [Falsochrobactrum sp. TDYN1]MBV2142549.1 cyclopropane-fatty-acyl-phospholipid synthase family protein [Falsochrobactrum sp. TDYN1]